MDPRTKVAAATASVVPFHCVICFEEFCLKERPPVVLPCGHTFLCAPCSARLKRCMECREPLYITLPLGTNKPPPTGSSVRGVPPPPSMYTRPSVRYSPSQQYPSTPPQGSGQHGPPAPPIQIPIPIPKNVVLISMMEAAARQSSTSENDEGNEVSDGSMDDDEEEAYDLNRIISGMATLTGPCGTYVVRESDVLFVSPHHPSKQNDNLEEKKQSDSDTEEWKDPTPLVKGQNLQVVDFVDGVAKLARCAGYVIASSDQLVKVNGPLDSNCRLEGLLDTVMRRGADLQRELDENKKIEMGIRREIELGLAQEPNHPVIGHPPTLSIDESFDQSDQSDNEECSTPGSMKNNPGKVDTTYCQTPEATRSHDFMLSASPSEDHPGDSSIISRLNSIDNSDLHSFPRLPSYRQMPDESMDYIYGCGAALLGTTHVFTGATHETRNRLPGEVVDDPSDDSHDNRASSGSNHGTYPGLSPSRSASFDTVDFRTGMSGHRALNVTKPKIVLSPNQRGNTRLMMSTHTGLGRVRGPAQASGNRNHSGGN